MILEIAMVIYIFTGFVFFNTAYFFLMSKNHINEGLKWAMVIMFTGLGLGVLIRGFWGLMELQLRVATNPIVSVISIMLVLCSILLTKQ